MLGFIRKHTDESTMRARHCRLTLFGLIVTGMAGLAFGGDQNTGPNSSKATDAVHALKARYQDVYSQVNPQADLAKLFPQANQISLAVAILPDPLVPRYRRLYDLDIAAIELGMLHQGYVLDRFYLPWVRLEPSTDDPKSEGTPSADATTDAPGNSSKRPSDRPRRKEPFGLMVFRCDGWRDDACGTDQSVKRSRFRALYVVTDTSTYGVSDRALSDAVERISLQLKANPAIQLLGYPACRTATAPTLLVLGPNFSGAMDSLGEESGSLMQGSITDVCVVSSSATNPTNVLVERYPHIKYVPLALDDSRKLEHLAWMLMALRGSKSLTMQAIRSGTHPQSSQSAMQQTSELRKDFSDVTILAESSTFGWGVCDQAPRKSNSLHEDLVEDLCGEAHVIYFPSSIADIRYGLQQQQQEQQATARNPLKIPIVSDQLALEMGTENGSEYPESQQYGSTSVSKQLALDQLLDQMRDTPPPRIVVVIATDVRDRLFLFEEVRKRLPRAMLVDLEADNLLAHPDFLHASRGAVSFGSAALLVPDPPLMTEEDEAASALERFGCSSQPQASARPARRGNAPVRNRRAQGEHPASSSWSTDYQAILEDTVTRLSDGAATRGTVPCLADEHKAHPARQSIPQIVTLEGFHQLALWPQSAEFRNLLQIPLRIAGAGAPLFCLAAALIWLAPWIRTRNPTSAGLGSVPSVASGAGPGAYPDNFLLGVCILYSILFVLVALGVRHLDRDNTLPYWAIVLGVLGIWGLTRCRRLLRTARNAVGDAEGGAKDDAEGRSWKQQLWLPALLALAAIFLAAMPLRWQWVRDTVAEPARSILDESSLLALAVDPAQGLAFFLATAIGAAALLYVSLVLATAACVVHRNVMVLEGAEPAATSVDEGVAVSMPATLKRAVIGPFAVVAAVILIGVIAAPDMVQGNVRLTVFGLSASRVALGALAATTLAATLLILGALGSNRRAKVLSGYLRNAYLVSRQLASPQPGTEIPGLWPTVSASTPTQFPATPAIARPSDAEHDARILLSGTNLRDWSDKLRGWLHDCEDDGPHRAAVFVLLASEISLHRWLVAGATLCALASVGVVYLFPIESDPLLALNLLVLAAAGVLAGYTAMTYESDGVMSNVLCDRPKKVKLSIALFGFIAIPFAALAVAIGIANIPGVVDWSGGLLALVQSLGLHP
jgi:hypothetical protein